MLGRVSDAQTMRSRLRELGADMTIFENSRWTAFRRREDIDRLAEAFRMAGVPE